MPRLSAVAALGLALAATPGGRAGQAPAADREPRLSVWYRGGPSGAPRAEDLQALRALGFSAVTWSRPDDTRDTVALVHLAQDAGLEVVTRTRALPLTPQSAARAASSVDVRPDRMPQAALWPLVWRAIAHGARVVSFDPGSASGAALLDSARRPPPWLATVAAIDRELGANGTLLGQCRAGPPLAVRRPAPAGLDVVLLEAQRTWVVVATNVAADRAHAVVRLPPVRAVCDVAESAGRFVDGHAGTGRRPAVGVRPGRPGREDLCDR